MRKPLPSRPRGRFTLSYVVVLAVPLVTYAELVLLFQIVLAVLRTEDGVTLEKGHESAEYHEALESTQEEIARSTVTIDGSFLFAKVESVLSNSPQIEVIVSELADEVLQLVEVLLCLTFKSLSKWHYRRTLPSTMTSSLRKLVLTAHIILSVGWIGAVAAFPALTISGLTSRNIRTVRVAYPAMELTARFVVVPWPSLCCQADSSRDWRA